jgi:erythronate-4-phosphate dehydrogenase
LQNYHFAIREATVLLLVKNVNFHKNYDVMRVVVDDKIPFLKGILEPFADLVYLPGKEINNKSLLNADALLIRTRTKCTEALLKGTTVKFIGTATIGFDHIDTQVCERAGIFWTNAPGCNSSSVQQYITAALLKLASEFRIDLAGKTLGIVGVGNVGSKVDKAARILGMNTLLNDPPRERAGEKGEFVTLGDVLYNSDFITAHVPLNVVGEDATWHLFDEKKFKKMKKGTWFINSSRGEVTETAALKNSLKSGKLGGAILDVWENEPDIDLGLMSATFLSTPHIAGYSTDGKANGTAMVVNSLAEHFKLPLSGWYPSEVPVPENHELTIDCKGRSVQSIIAEAVAFTYNIDEDNINLRFSPADFEKQRGSYRLRREFNAFSISLKHTSADAKNALRKLGFKVS